jgi:hypothetical protein
MIRRAGHDVRRRGDPDPDLFRPLRPAKGTKLVLAAVIGPVAWVIAWLVAAWLISRSNIIETGLLLTIGAFLFAVPVLGLLSWGRRREERRCVREGRRAAHRP